ncbi:MAG: hypothetical protein HC789_23805 [Microcoleus sp. CSU_2_2]|nr:hypothetical protein [Microcoleus sp. SU_5_3]NJS13178.1 hypothetical protein [Microcoleus sp. CSU_2_2]
MFVTPLLTIDRTCFSSIYQNNAENPRVSTEESTKQEQKRFRSAALARFGTSFQNPLASSWGVGQA